MSNLIRIEDTNFIYTTNFSGDPDADKYKSTTRKGNLIIPDPEMAMELREQGFNVKETRPREGYEDEFVPTYYMSIILNYRSAYPPTVYLVNDNEPVFLDEESVDILDRIRVRNVKCMLNGYEWEEGRFTAYVKTMYVEQDLSDDPFADYYRSLREAEPIEDDEPPFDV